MAYDWRLNLYAEDGQLKATYPSYTDISSFSEVTVTGSGNCVEAKFLAKSSSFSTIEGLDIIKLETQENGGSWIPMFYGMLTKTASRPEARLHEYRAIGMKQRFHKVMIERVVSVGNDIASMARSILFDPLYAVPGIIYQSANIPNTNITLGDRVHKLESIYDFMEFLVSHLPNGEWGVNAAGQVFLTSTVTTLAITTNPSITVQWKPTNHEGIVSKVGLLLATEPGGLTGEYAHVDPAQPGINLPVYIPLPYYHVYDSGRTPVQSLGSPYPLEKGVLKKVFGLTNDHVNMQPGLDSQGQYVGNLESVTSFSSFYAYDSKPNYFEIKYQSPVDTEIILIYYQATQVGFNAPYLISRYTLPKTYEGNNPASGVEYIFKPHSTYVNNPASKTLRIQYNSNALAANSFRLYNIDAYEKNTAALDLIAQTSIYIPPKSVADVTFTNAHILPHRRLNMVNFNVLEKVGLFVYSITKEKTVSTLVKVGLDDEADFKTEDEVLKLANHRQTTSILNITGF